ncbi:hypothetical protein Dshi_0229 [Dinoroseobacter shibae DFL 12 = DSM 16493]|uniref:Uncharacterized protein n=1 Tax=Dinoroseobacter shibae (strain DSM 16493 / NCIMB 14021 / DFL 12) TaxID=398580 RepID=A8LLG8_DINSH|nr:MULTISPECIES: hypothetical protein [Dinoroseobacter]ABV91978.1 hypothetical protein Dshi_0229 [Dinoroseobacter shibae DFL 12 = DSM 16493]MDD9718979.1 hypothetical protein [Dinoroseobacter sp. PD6]URF46949.1 hypothetical protein M8008_01165 [Dinoroseobacter shibae]URF51260.1 hypothetical protein M8007_01165 [Dinoroseobacter shibae]
MEGALPLIGGLICLALAVTRSLVAAIEQRAIWPTLLLAPVGLGLLAVAWQAQPDGLQLEDIPVAVVKIYRTVMD